MEEDRSSSQKLVRHTVVVFASSSTMHTSQFAVTEHIIPCQYIREYPHAIKSEHASPRPAVKEYQPLEKIDASAPGVTIIAAHGNGFPKECCEPLFDDLYQALAGKIHRICFADCAHQGASGVLHESRLGDDRKHRDIKPSAIVHPPKKRCLREYLVPISNLLPS